MTKKITYCFIAFTFCFCYLTRSQTKLIDSLLANVISKNCSPPRHLKGDTVVAKQLAALGRELSNTGNYDSSVLFNSAALELSKKLNFKPGIASASGNMGLVYLDKGQSVKALEAHFYALKIAEEIGNKTLQAINLNNIGIIYFRLTETSKAQTYYLRAFEIDKSTGNKKGMAIRLGNLGNVYMEQQNYAKALNYYFMALKLRKEIGSKRLISSTLGNIATTYRNQGDSAISKGNKDFAAKIKFPQAIEYYLNALKFAEEANDKQGLCVILGNVGVLQSQIGKEKEGLNFLFRALNISSELELKEYQCGTMRDLSKLYENAKTFLPDSSGNKLLSREQMLRRSLNYYHRFLALRDELYNEEIKKQIALKETNFEFDKKEAISKTNQEKERALAQEKQKFHQIIIAAVVLGLILVLVFAGYIFRSLKTSNKQKKLIEIKNKEIEEKQKDILDSIHYAKRIQNSLLPTESYIEKALSRHQTNDTKK